MKIRSIKGYVPEARMCTLTLIVDMSEDDRRKMENDELYVEYILKKYEKEVLSRFHTFMYDLFKR